MTFSPAHSPEVSVSKTTIFFISFTIVGVDVFKLLVAAESAVEEDGAVAGDPPFPYCLSAGLKERLSRRALGHQRVSFLSPESPATPWGFHDFHQAFFQSFLLFLVDEMAATDMLAECQADFLGQNIFVVLAERLATERGTSTLLDGFLMRLKVFVKGILQPSEARPGSLPGGMLLGIIQDFRPLLFKISFHISLSL